MTDTNVKTAACVVDILGSNLARCPRHRPTRSWCFENTDPRTACPCPVTRRHCQETSASKSFIRRFVITEKAPTRAFSWLKAATTAFTFKTLLRYYAKQALTPRSLSVKLVRNAITIRDGLVSKALSTKRRP